MIMKKNTLVLFFSALLCTIAASASPSGLRSADSPVANDAPKNVTASRDNKEAVTVVWDAVPNAASYEVTAEAWDVAINRTVRTVTTDETQFVDSLLPQPGLARYTVKAVFPDGTKSEPSDAAVGYAVLETLQILNVSTRYPWNGKVDIDVEYKTVRPRFRELFGMENLPYPSHVTLSAQTADGTILPVRSLVRESPLSTGTYTVNRATVQNGFQDGSGTMIFRGSGNVRFVWDADKDTLGINAPGTILTLTASDDYAHTTDTTTFDLNTTKPAAIPLIGDDAQVSLPWAARWASEASLSLNMQDGSDIKITAVSKLGTVTEEIDNQIMLADEGGISVWQPSHYGIIQLKASFYNRATHDSSTYKSKFIHYLQTPVKASPIPGEKAISVEWTASGDCTYYQIVRRTVGRDGSRGAWKNMMGVGTERTGKGSYTDISPDYETTYEYAACPKYVDVDDNGQSLGYITTAPGLCASARLPIGIKLDVQTGDSILLSWTDVPDAFSYDVYRDNGDGNWLKMANVPYTAGTTFTDTDVEPARRYYYKVRALDWEGRLLETSDSVTCYSQLDALSLGDFQPRFPWNGLVDVFVTYKSARDSESDGTPHFQMTAMNAKDTITVKTLTLADGNVLDPNDFTLSDDGIEQHLLWNAGADIGEGRKLDSLVLAISCVRVAPHPNTDTVAAFTAQPITSPAIGMDTRTVAEVVLDQPTRIYADLRWFANATLLELWVNDKKVFTTTDVSNNSFVIGKEQLSIWGTNTLKLKADNGEEWNASIKYPDFSFTATQGNRDGVLIDWNRLDGVQSYSVRRRAAQTDDAFEEVALVGDSTCWTDSSAETVVGEFEYTVMPLLASGEDAGPQLAAVMGYRAEDIARLVMVISAQYGGCVDYDKLYAHYGETVTLTVVPYAGYRLEQLCVMDGETEVPTVMSEDGSCYTFTMPANDVIVFQSFVSTGTGVKTVKGQGKAPRKIIRDGHVIIIWNGREYTTTGVKLK